MPSWLMVILLSSVAHKSSPGSSSWCLRLIKEAASICFILHRFRLSDTFSFQSDVVDDDDGDGDGCTHHVEELLSSCLPEKVEFLFLSSRLTQAARDAMHAMAMQRKMSTRKRKRKNVWKDFFSKNQPLAHASSCPLHAYLDKRALACSHTHAHAHTRTRSRTCLHAHTRTYILARAWYLPHTCFVNNHLAFLSCAQAHTHTHTRALSLFSTHISSVVSCMLVHVQWYSVVFGTAA